ncbi:jg8335 [Pararge aegeria aegeria]|uniref:Jg8335 protein n=1 Tax=Pararge aegeria aegeria TaxID=348720 RepID=A0A8S4SIE7_9NEOP|nr:jg8335 [Pararge aegeria aegeria]
MLGVSLRDQIRNVEIRKEPELPTRVSSEKEWTLGSQGAGMAAPSLVLIKMEAGRAFQILAVRIRNVDAKRFVRVRGISTT